MPTKKSSSKSVKPYSLGKENKNDYTINKNGKPTKSYTVDKSSEAKKVIDTLNRPKKTAMKKKHMPKLTKKK